MRGILLHSAKTFPLKKPLLPLEFGLLKVTMVTDDCTEDSLKNQSVQLSSDRRSLDSLIELSTELTRMLAATLLAKCRPGFSW